MLEASHPRCGSKGPGWPGVHNTVFEGDPVHGVKLSNNPPPPPPPLRARSGNRHETASVPKKGCRSSCVHAYKAAGCFQSSLQTDRRTAGEAETGGVWTVRRDMQDATWSVEGAARQRTQGHLCSPFTARPHSHWTRLAFRFQSGKPGPASNRISLKKNLSEPAA